MQQYPHHYPVSATARTEGNITTSSPELPDLLCAPPAQFGGPGDQWSPETLLVAAVADCFILTFRAIARASRLSWEDLRCDTEGVLDRVDGVTRFTRFVVRAQLTLPAGGDAEKARRLLEKAEHNCLITSSLSAECELECNIGFASA
jgi:peroxiredoxin-like protein